MRRFLLARELPAISTLAIVGAVFGFANQQPAGALWLLFAALWCAAFWLILFLPRQPRQASHQPDKRHDDRNHRQHGQSRRTPRRAA